MKKIIFFVDHHMKSIFFLLDKIQLYHSINKEVIPIKVNFQQMFLLSRYEMKFFSFRIEFRKQKIHFEKHRENWLEQNENLNELKSDSINVKTILIKRWKQKKCNNIQTDVLSSLHRKLIFRLFKTIMTHYSNDETMQQC